MKQILLDTTYGRLNVRDSGATGPAVLMIHGNSSSGGVFRKQMTGAIGQRYRMLAPDLPGHGASADAQDPARVYNIPAFASAMIEVLDRLGIERPIVFGWSLGGHIGIEMLPRLPGIRGLFITGTPPTSLADAGRAFQQQPVMALTAQEHFSAQEVDDYARACCGEPLDATVRADVARTDGRARRAMFENFLNGGLPDQGRIVATASVPIAVVNGAEEPFVDLAFLSTVRFGNLWEGHQHLVAGTGHAPFWEKPQDFDPIFERFLDDIAST